MMTPELALAVTRLEGRARRMETWAAEYRRTNHKEAAGRTQDAADLRLVIAAVRAAHTPEGGA